MDKKIKLLVIGLGVLAAISLLIAFQLNIVNQKLQARRDVIEQELTQVSKENERITRELSSALEKNRGLSSQLQEAEVKGRTIQDEINRIKERLDLTSKERDSLINKVQSLIDEKRKLQEGPDLAKAKKQEAVSGISPSFVPASSQEAFWAEVLRQKTAAELELESVRSQLKEITFRADEFMREKNGIEMELKSIIQTKEDLERRASYNEKLANSLSEDLVREKSDKEALSEQLNKLKQDNSQMRSRIKDLESTKATLYRKLDNLEQERNAIKRKLGEAESVVSERVDEIIKIKKDIGEIKNKGVSAAVPGSRTVELAPIIVHGKQEAAGPTLTGRVLSLNKQNDFVIIDLGEAAGVKINDRFNVYRDDKFICNIEVIMMRKDISAADIKEIAVNEEIKTGDVVKLIN